MTPDASVLARALADGIGNASPVTAGLILELVRRPGAQAHRSILLGHEQGWLEIVTEALMAADESTVGA